ncbi:MAG: lipopolysaccharide biosynthesis protein [Pseudomonadota bacterium]
MTDDRATSKAATKAASKANAKSAWARIKRNLAIILGERAIFAVLNLVSAGIATRAVGLEVIGAIGLLFAYSRLVSDVLKFNSWQAVLTFGSALKEHGELPELRRLIGLSIWVDIGAIVISLTVAIMGARFFGEWLGWTPEMIAYAPWFCIIIPFITHMTHVGILRLFDRVGMLAAQHALTAIVRFIGTVAIWYWGGGLLELAITWVASAVIAGLAVYVGAWAVAAEHQALPRMAAAARRGGEGFKGFWRFMFATSVISTLDKIVVYAATLIVGAVLGPVEAGIFHLVRQITEAMLRPGDLLGPLFFPEFALLEAKGDRRAMRRLVMRAMIYGGLILLAVVGVLVVGGEFILVTLFGPETADGYAILVMAGFAASIFVWGFTLEPVLLSLGQATRTVYGDVLALITFAGLTWAFVVDLGLVGIGIALIGHRIVQIVWRAAIVLRVLAKSRL